MTPLFSPGMPATRFRLGNSTLLRYMLVILISALLHGGAWQYRQWLDHRSNSLPKPKPPIEVILTPAPPPVIVPPKPIPPAPVVEPVKPKPLPKAPPAPKPVPAAPKPVAPPAPPKPAPPPKPRPEVPKPRLAPPPPKVEPPPKPLRPTRRELEDDPNLPALPKPEPIIAKRIEPPPPRPEPRPVREAPPVRAPAPPPRPSETRPRLEARADTAPTHRSPSAESRANAPVTPASRPAAVAGSPAASRPATTGSVGGATESAKANASYLHNPKPEYPALAKRRQWEGRVLLKVRVLANGTVAAVSVETSSGHELLDESALEAVRQWHFVPAKRGGQAVDSWVNVPINFNLLDSPH